MKTTLLAAALLALAACGSSSQPVQTPAPPEPPTEDDPDDLTPPGPGDADAGLGAAPDSRSLYERLGGQEAIVAVVDDFVGRTTTDPRIKDRFFNVEAPVLKQRLVEFVCLATGGPCRYAGRDMVSSHAGMELVDEEFVALVEDLTASLDRFRVGEREKGELLGALGPLQPQIVAPAHLLRPIEPSRLAEVRAAATQLADTDSEARRLLEMAVQAGGRGQRSYAEQLFTRAELEVGTERLAALAPVFREGAPPRVATAPTPAAEAAPQPEVAGSSEEDAPVTRKKPAAWLSGRLQVNGGKVQGLGVVMLTPERGGKKRVAKQRVVEQRNKVFMPRILAVPVGSTVAFPNHDKVFHNVFSLSKANAFDLGMYRSGEQREVTFDRPGVVRLGCNIHAAMAGYVVVVDAPHYVVVGDDGSFKFHRLAPGTYTVRAWSERTAEPMVTRIEIKPGANQQVLDLAGDADAGPGPDKFNQPRGAEAPGERR